MNTLVVGNTGTGKTTNFLYGDIIQACKTESNIIAFCHTAKFPKLLKDYLVEQGYRLYFVNGLTEGLCRSIAELESTGKYMVFVDVKAKGLNDIFDVLLHRLESSHRFETFTVVILDEMLSTEKIEKLYYSLSTPRTQNVSFSLLTQSVSALEKLYGDDFEALIGNVEEIVFLNSISVDDEKYLDAFFGKSGASNMLMMEYRRTTGKDNVWLRGNRYDNSSIVLEPWENGFVKWITAKE